MPERGAAAAETSLLKVCHLSTVHPINDNRIFHKQCKTLVEAGHNVTLILAHDRNEVRDGIKIIGLGLTKSRWHRCAVQAGRCLKYAIRQKAQVYHFHDPELIGAGIILKLLGKTVVFDVHENLPQQVLNKEWVGPLWFRGIISRSLVGILKCCGAIFDDIIVARPDIAEYWKPGKAAVIMNSASLNTIDQAPVAGEPKDKPVVIYAGGLSRIRGIKELVDAMAIVGDRAQLWLLGPWHDEGLYKDCQEAPGWQHVRYLGYKTVHEVFGLMKQSNIGVITFLPGPNHLTTIPTKPFEYMACRLPVIMSNFDYWRKLFADCAVYVDPASPRDIADKILKLLDDPTAASSLGLAGRALVEDSYSWEAERDKLLTLYSNLQVHLRCGRE